MHAEAYRLKYIARQDRGGHTGRRGALFTVLSAVVALAVSAFPACLRAEQPLSGDEVRAAILRAADCLKRAQGPDGTWPDYAQEGGVTALATYALLQAGVAPDDKAVAAALLRIARTPNQSTYVVSLKTLALVAADPKKHQAEIQGCADWLAQTQSATGAWGYGKAPGDVARPPSTVPVPAQPGAAGPQAAGRPGAVPVPAQPGAAGPQAAGRPGAVPVPAQPGAAGPQAAARTGADLQRVYERPDTSNTQFAILALSEAERAGARVPADVWKKADRHFRLTQLPGGGWGYVYHDPDDAEAYGSMTAAVIASLYLCQDRLARQEPAETTFERLAAIERGVEWIAGRYTLKENPGRSLAWYYFWLYSLERAGVTGGRRMFGDHDWFREGTALLVAGQKPDGSWTDRLYQDALCLLFLAKGYRPLLVQRLEWQGQWRRDPRDLDHLVRYLEKRIGGEYAAWQTVKSGAPLEDYLAAPILHVTGSGTLRMLAGSVPHIKEYVDQGGLVVFDAEGGDGAFTESVRRMLGQQFPESKFEPMPADHPILRAVHPLPPGSAAAAGLEVMNIGCRASVILAPKGLADGWADGDPAKPNDALFLGENLAAYATASGALPDRLATAAILQMPREEPSPQDAFRVGQIQHDGDWNPRPYAMPRLLKDLAERFAVSVYTRPAPVRLTDPKVGGANILYMTGHYAFHLSEAERAALKDRLDHNGFLLAEACCGRAAFDKAFRDLVREMYPGAALEELPADHPIYSGKVGAPIRTVRYSPAVLAESPGLRKPVLFGLKIGGRLAIVYSPYGLASGLDGLKTYGARNLAPDDARQLAINIMLYHVLR